jgi:hypothetical protein
LYNKLYDLSQSCGFVVELLYSFSTCCGQVESHAPLIRFVVYLLLSPQQIHNILACRDVADCCGLVEKLWICCGLLWICCTTCCTINAQQIELVEFEL